MSKEQPIELFMPPNMLKAKVGGSGSGGIDLSLMKRAQGAMESLKQNFGDWLSGDIAKLGATRDRFVASPDAKTRKELYNASHDIKGQAATFEFPMIARAAASLCRLMDETGANALPTPLIDGHIDAIRAFFRDNMKGNENPVANSLVAALEANVAEVAAARS